MTIYIALFIVFAAYGWHKEQVQKATDDIFTRYKVTRRDR